MFAPSNSGNIAHVLRNREVGLEFSINQFKHQRLIHNMATGNCKKTILDGHRYRIIGFDVRDNLAATVSADRTIKLWDIETGKCLWTFDPIPTVYWHRQIKIVEGHVICGGSSKASEENFYHETIRVIDLKRGNERSAINSQNILKETIYTIGQRIFSFLNDHTIGEWNFDGTFIQSTPLEKILFVVKGYLLNPGIFILGNSHHIFINFQNAYNYENVPLLEIPNSSQGITSAQVDDNFLILGVDTSHEDEHAFDCCVIDRTSGKQNKYRCFIDGGRIMKIIVNEQWAYLGHTNGTIAALNLSTKTSYILGKHATSILFLAVEGDILISGSSLTNGIPGEIKFWDMRSMTNIREMGVGMFQGISFISGRVFTAVYNSLVVSDYLDS